MTETATIALLGDVMLGRLVSEQIGRRPPESLWGDVLPVLQGVDAVIANLECAVARSGRAWERYPKVFHFRAVPEAIEVLQAARVTAVNLANNHTLDYETEALLETLEHLDKAGIVHAGAGADAAAAAQPAFARAGPLRFALFGVTDNEPAFGATESAPGVCFYNPVSGEPLAPSRGAISEARAQGADLVVVSAHLGPNMVLRPAEALRGYKRQLAEAGADIVHGHSAHVFQGIERTDTRLILHDTGDFLDDYAVDRELRNDWSFLFIVEADAQGPRRLILRPVRLGFARVSFATGDEADEICARMQQLSLPFGTGLERTADGLSLSFER
ncbi:MAG TPA: CapA family protein [Alphaproteobacteria bacterium]|nr:CapA family protein [Alphaproteobacteria bacterium]